MKLSFQEAAHSVTESRHMLEVPGFKLLIDPFASHYIHFVSSPEDRQAFEPHEGPLRHHFRLRHVRRRSCRASSQTRDSRRSERDCLRRLSSRAYPRTETCRRVGTSSPIFGVPHSAPGADRQIQRAFGPCGSPGSLAYVRAIQPSPSKVILVHGEEKQALSLAVAIQAEYPRIEVTVPHAGSTIEI